MADFVLGMNGKAYYENAATGLANLDVLSNVRDVTLNLSAGEADITTRANAGWRATAATLRECTAEFEMVWKDSDTGFDALKTAWLTGATIEMAFLTGVKGIAGTNSEGPYGD